MFEYRNYIKSCTGMVAKMFDCVNQKHNKMYNTYLNIIIIYKNM